MQRPSGGATVMPRYTVSDGTHGAGTRVVGVARRVKLPCASGTYSTQERLEWYASPARKERRPQDVRVSTDARLLEPTSRPQALGALVHDDGRVDRMDGGLQGGWPARPAEKTAEPATNECGHPASA